MRTILAGFDPNQATVTVWVYPDSFEQFRVLKEELYKLGYLTASRPMPEGQPISGSPQGTRSGGVVVAAGRTMSMRSAVRCDVRPRRGHPWTSRSTRHRWPARGAGSALGLRLRAWPISAPSACCLPFFTSSTIFGFSASSSRQRATSASALTCSMPSACLARLDGQRRSPACAETPAWPRVVSSSPSRTARIRSASAGGSDREIRRWRCRSH